MAIFNIYAVKSERWYRLPTLAKWRGATDSILLLLQIFPILAGSKDFHLAFAGVLYLQRKKSLFVPDS